MGNIIQIKRGSGKPTVSQLSHDGELGFDKTNNTLYINKNGVIVALTETAQDLLSRLKTVDGAGSGLDADLLDGKHATDFANVSHEHAIADINDLSLTLSAKSNIGHIHSIANISNLQTTLNTLALKDHVHEPEVLTLTLVNGYTGGTGHDIPTIYRIGKLAIVSGYVVPNRTQTTGLIFANIPTGWRPAHQVSRASGTLISPPNMFRYAIAPAGSMTIWPIHGSTERYPIDAVYVIGG